MINPELTAENIAQMPSLPDPKEITPQQRDALREYLLSLAGTSDFNAQYGTWLNKYFPITDDCLVG